MLQWRILKEVSYTSLFLKIIFELVVETRSVAFIVKDASRLKTY